ncbi:hypothetical protein B0T26DRAFT_751448 [Lasiosphaeria miniovina]|uniref:Uncharacterized protein n=1 Tax=Lasiosphaeria miniovina TaxID=1954250 RepID=A0AA40AK87_9PEZI|nr:uncharacterized protein B0T26DRAFT_751448 [Lasiosphaeria miniovina]KAK0717373.1 hypothetical protein B0T26DRAFT_751448 [Lasiosphaeria miniovina]
MQEGVFPKEVYKLEFENLAGLHGRRLQFLNEARPRARYMWWTFLSAITQLTWKVGYVKKNMLLGFINEIGHDISNIAESIMEHAIEEERGPANPGPEQPGLAIVADQVVRRTQEYDGFDYEAELEEDEGKREDD